jgi:hypothetical protein
VKFAISSVFSTKGNSDMFEGYNIITIHSPDDVFSCNSVPHQVLYVAMTGKFELNNFLAMMSAMYFS